MCAFGKALNILLRRQSRAELDYLLRGRTKRGGLHYFSEHGLITLHGQAFMLTAATLYRRASDGEDTENLKGVLFIKWRNSCSELRLGQGFASPASQALWLFGWWGERIQGRMGGCLY